MKDTLREAFDKFGTSKAVFVGRKGDGGIYFELKEQYDPRAQEGDVVANLVATHYSENFDKQAGYFVKQEGCMDAAARAMFVGIRKAFSNASPLKNPEQSKLYRWMDCDKMTGSLARREGLISLFRYVRANTDGEHFRFEGGSDNIHAKNLVAILEKMKEKYEQR